MGQQLRKGFDAFNKAMTDPRLPVVLDNSVKLMVLATMVISFASFVLITLRVFGVI